MVDYLVQYDREKRSGKTTHVLNSKNTLRFKNNKWTKQSL